MAAAGRASKFLRWTRRTPVWTLYGAGLVCSLALFKKHLYSFELCDGPSMFPTLHRFGDYLLISKRYRYGHGIGIGDIIVYRQPQFSFVRSAKRVVGMPGDYIVLDIPCDENDPDTTEESTMAQVPEGHIWVVGDNLPYSRDSREYGAVPLGLITGKAIARAYWAPPASPRFQRLENPFENEPVQSP